METEKQLLTAILNGNQQAMRQLYERYCGYAMTVALRYIPDRDAVQDVLQDSFVKAFSAIQRFKYRGEGSLKAWLMRIVANQSLTYLRENQRLQVTNDLIDVPDNEHEEEVDTRQLPIDVLLKMIQQLPDGYRTVFNLFVFEQKSHQEIAHTLGIKENSSASQFFRAKNMLARMINDYKRKSNL